MTLSDAIRLGSTLAPPSRPRKWTFTGQDFNGACALRAAGLAIGRDVHDPWTADQLSEVWPILRMAVHCPACDAPLASLSAIVMGLHDSHGWSREQIAAWVETVEAQESDVGELIDARLCGAR